MVLDHETGEGFADNQADIQRQAGILARRPARALQGDDMVGVLEDQSAGTLVGDDLLQVGQPDLLLHHHQAGDRFQRHDFAVIAFGEGRFFAAGIRVLRWQMTII